MPIKPVHYMHGHLVKNQAMSKFFSLVRPQTLDVHHEKTDLKVFVVVIPKKGWARHGRAWPCPSFFWYDTDFSEFDSADIIDYILEKSVSYFWYDNDRDLKVCFLVTHLTRSFGTRVSYRPFLQESVGQ